MPQGMPKHKSNKKTCDRCNLKNKENADIL